MLAALELGYERLGNACDPGQSALGQTLRPSDFREAGGIEIAHRASIRQVSHQSLRTAYSIALRVSGAADPEGGENQPIDIGSDFKARVL